MQVTERVHCSQTLSRSPAPFVRVSNPTSRDIGEEPIAPHVHLGTLDSPAKLLARKLMALFVIVWVCVMPPLESACAGRAAVLAVRTKERVLLVHLDDMVRPVCRYARVLMASATTVAPEMEHVIAKGSGGDRRVPTTARLDRSHHVTSMVCATV